MWLILCIIVINFVVKGSLCKLRGLHFIKINCQHESRDSLTGTAEVSCEWFFSSPCSKIELFLALVAPGNCCHAYISIDTLGGAGFSLFFSFPFFQQWGDAVVRTAKRRWLVEWTQGIIDFRRVEDIAVCFHSIGYGAMKRPLFNSNAWVVAWSMEGVPGGAWSHEIKLEIKIANTAKDLQ